MPFLVHFPPSNNPPPSPKGTRAGLLKGGRLIPLEFDTFSCWLPIFDRLKRKSSSLQEQGGFHGSQSSCSRAGGTFTSQYLTLVSSILTGLLWCPSCVLHVPVTQVTDCWGFGVHRPWGQMTSAWWECRRGATNLLRMSPLSCRRERERRNGGIVGSERSQPVVNNQRGLWGDPGELLSLNEGFWICGNSGEVMATLMSSWVTGIIPLPKMGVTAANGHLCLFEYGGRGFSEGFEVSPAGVPRVAAGTCPPAPGSAGPQRRFALRAC